MGGLIQAVGVAFMGLLAVWLASFLLGSIVGFMGGLFS